MSNEMRAVMRMCFYVVFGLGLFIVVFAGIGNYRAAERKATDAATAATIQREADAKREEDNKKVEEARRMALLPDRTPNGVPLDDKKMFYLKWKFGGWKEEELKNEVPKYLAMADDLVSLARMSGLRCDSVTLLKVWLFSRGMTLSCNRHDYEYEGSDKGRGWQIKIAGE